MNEKAPPDTQFELKRTAIELKQMHSMRQQLNARSQILKKRAVATGLLQPSEGRKPQKMKLSLKQAADLLCVSTRTIHNCLADGRIKDLHPLTVGMAIRTSIGNHQPSEAQISSYEDWVTQEQKIKTEKLSDDA